MTRRYTKAMLVLEIKEAHTLVFRPFSSVPRLTQFLETLPITFCWIFRFFFFSPTMPQPVFEAS